MEMNFRIGDKVLLRNGKTANILRIRGGDKNFPIMTDPGDSYMEDGSFVSKLRHHTLDIVENKTEKIRNSKLGKLIWTGSY